MAVLKADLIAPKLRELHGNIAAVARCFGVTRQAAWGYIQKRPKLLAVCQECREIMKDHAESSLYKNVLEGEAWAVCFYLKTQAKDRGYVERTESQQVGSIRLEVVEELHDGSHDPAQDLPTASGPAALSPE